MQKKLALLFIALGTLDIQAQITFPVETFNTPSSTAADGWVPSTNPPPPIGWVGSSNAGGSPGELGGHYAIVIGRCASFFLRPTSKTDQTTIKIEEPSELSTKPNLTK